MLLNNNLENKVLIFVLALLIVVALFVIALSVLDVSHFSALPHSIFEIAGEAGCSPCVNGG